MKRIEIKLSLDVVAPLLDIVKEAGDSLKERLAIQPPPPVPDGARGGDDDDMARIWRDTLQDSQNMSIVTLLTLFDSDFFTTGTISLDRDNAEPVVRACTALRLQIRRQFLAEITDESLEHSLVEIDQLEEPARRAMMCYLFLATIQELVIKHLESSILEGK